MTPAWDVIVVGAGPAGSTAAALLAKSGVRVLVLERDHFPRFHIGESLLPSGLPVHDAIGLELNRDAFLFKGGAVFVCEASGRQVRFDFNEGLPGLPRHAWQVERSEFDTMVRDRALFYGAEVRHGTAVSTYSVTDSKVTVETQHGIERGRYLIDATGQDRLLARRNGTVRPYRHFGRAAVFRHFAGLSDAAIEEIGPQGDIRVILVPDGWAWAIPLAGRRLSVGLVSRLGGITHDSFDRFLDDSPMLQRWIEGAQASDPQIVSNFSYRNERPFGARFACLGDSACFLDPVFSSGVSLAMNSAQQAVELLVPALADGREGENDLMEPLRTRLDPAYDCFASLIYRFYNTRFIESVFFGAPEDAELRASITSVLAGDFWSSSNPFRDMLLRSRTRPWRSEDQAAAAR